VFPLGDQRRRNSLSRVDIDVMRPSFRVVLPSVEGGDGNEGGIV